MTFQYSGTTLITGSDDNFKFIVVENRTLAAYSNGSSTDWSTTLNDVVSEVHCIYRENENDVIYNVYQ